MRELGVGPSQRDCMRILEATRRRQAEWVDLLMAIAGHETPTTEPHSQRPVQEILGSAFEGLGMQVEVVPGTKSGGVLLARPASIQGRLFQLLIGHSDTVWSTGTLARMPLQHEEGVVRGPGVFDMKGGLAHMVIALRVLRELDLEPEVAPVIFVNSDEETGSDDSTALLERLAGRADRAFILEPAAGPGGKLKTMRKGMGDFRIEVKGRSAHAGLDPEKGASAIQELALLTTRLHALKDPERGISVNVGVIRAGVRPNVVASEGWIEVDVRVDTIEDGKWITELIRGMEPEVPGCTLNIEGGMEKAPLEPTPRNRELFGRAVELGGAMGLPLEETRVGGGSDGNTTSLHTATLDGLGCVGDGAHADHEWVGVEKSVERCALLAALLLTPGVEGGATGRGWEGVG